MADLPASFSNVNTVEGSEGAIGSELQYLKLGSNDNYLKEAIDQEILDRDAADIAIQSDIDDVETALETLVDVKQFVYANSISYNSLWMNTIIFGSIGIDRRVAVAWAEKRETPDETWIKIQVFFDTVDRMGIDHYFQPPVFIDPDSWDTFEWYHDADALRIHYRFYKNITITV